MSNILLSIIIPTCNRLDTLPRALNSILFQNMINEDLEVVIIDDSKESQVEKNKFTSESNVTK
ncbi:glycosyltransferase family 2 protein [Shewanella putrefaciens]|nr:glycosyltransferase family 2 protein [Shewanella putrefaciens]